jgi:membrane fusion protein (multidrug efflux system)
LVVLGIGVWGVYTYIVSRNIVSTDDAYVSGDVIQVTSQVPGTVIGLYADDTQSVHAGQLLVQLDPADSKVSMESAEAGLAQAVRRVRALLAQADQLRAQVTARQADLKRAQDDAKRRALLIATGAVSKEDLSHAQDVSASQAAALAGAEAQLAQTLAQIGNNPVRMHPDILSAASQLRKAALSLRRDSISASADGLIAQRSVQIGQHIESGTPLMAIVPLSNIWINANFKEGQLQKMRVGQPVEIGTEVYGGKVVYHGKVAGVAAGSGNAFALLPAQNATGNWIKIVQRVPVRILLNPDEVKSNPLRIGLTATVKVDVTDMSGPTVAAQVRNQPFPAERSEGDDPDVGALIDKIVSDNLGSPALATAGTQ